MAPVDFISYLAAVMVWFPFFPGEKDFWVYVLTVSRVTPGFSQRSVWYCAENWNGGGALCVHEGHNCLRDLDVKFSSQGELVCLLEELDCGCWRPEAWPSSCRCGVQLL